MTTGDSHNGSDSQHRLSDQMLANTPYGLDAAGGWQKGLLIRRKLAQPEAFTFT